MVTDSRHSLSPRDTSPEGYRPQFLDELSPREYYGLVEVININRIEDITRYLEAIDLPEGIFIGVAGSDGKLEQHAQSKTELIVVQKNEELNGDTILKDFLDSYEFTELFDKGMDGVIDTKTLESDMPLSYAFSNRDAVYPDRILNILPIYPTDSNTFELYFKAREQALIEMVTESRIRSKLKAQLKDYKRSMQTGKFRNIPTFDTEESVQYYSELLPNYSTGFKSAFLRAVQRKLDLLTIQLEGKEEWSKVAKEIPTSTLDRIAYLSDHGVIPNEEGVLTGEAYAWFLQQYHGVQEQYKQTGMPTKLAYDPVLFEQHKQTIEYFVNL